MSREEKIREKIKEILNKRFGREIKENSYIWFTSDYQSRFLDLQEMVEWTDEHPKEGLWDSKKLIKFIKENVREYHKSGVFHIDDFIKDLTKAMEE